MMMMVIIMNMIWWKWKPYAISHGSCYDDYDDEDNDDDDDDDDDDGDDVDGDDDKGEDEGEGDEEDSHVVAQETWLVGGSVCIPI